DPPRLRAREVVAHDPSRGEIDREGVVHRIPALPVFRGDETGAAVRVEEATSLEQPGSPRMVELRAGPEDAHLPVDLLPRDAVVVGGAAARGLAQLVEDLAGRAIWELVRTPEPVREVPEDGPVLARAAGWDNGLA